jgi:hypothetical protein
MVGLEVKVLFGEVFGIVEPFLLLNKQVFIQ